MMSVINALKWRYACKAFDPEKIVSEDKIQRLKEGLNLTASSYGLQPFKFLVLTDKEKRELLVEHSWNQRQVVDASHLFIIAIRTDIDESFIKDYINLISEQRGIPADQLEAFKGMMNGSILSKSVEEQQIWAKNQAYITLGNLLLQCGLEEVDATPMEGFIPSKYDEILGLTEMNLKSVLVCPVGYRSENDPYVSLKKVRQPLNSICIDL